MSAFQHDEAVVSSFVHFFEADGAGGDLFRVLLALTTCARFIGTIRRDSAFIGHLFDFESRPFRRTLRQILGRRLPLPLRLFDASSPVATVNIA